MVVCSGMARARIGIRLPLAGAARLGKRGESARQAAGRRRGNIR